MALRVLTILEALQSSSTAQMSSGFIQARASRTKKSNDKQKS